MATPLNLMTGRSRSDFTVAYVLDALVKAGLITQTQASEIQAKETAARARVLKSRGLTGKEAARYDVSPIEVIAAFELPVNSGRQGDVLDQDRVTEATAKASGIAYRKIDPLKLDMALATRTVSKPYAEKHVLLPLEKLPGNKLVVAFANPFDRELLENVQSLAGMQVEPVFSAKVDILKSISEVYGFKKTLARAADDFSNNPQIANFEQLVKLSGTAEMDASDKPIVQAVDFLLRYAFDNRASDIHIEPKRETAVVRFRIDGVLHPVYTLPAGVHSPVASRVKMISRMDISEKRRPQDGRIKTERDGKNIELRVSTLPTAFGEKIVIRIFDPEALVQDIAQLGFEPDEKAIFNEWIDRPHGLILVTGPTGSGKTTTLYSALKALAGPDVNVTTIEDPIEMVWEPFNQVQVQPKLDFDFATALRHILRQDPDIIMVGEIRDGETAENAIQSALTGHLVLSTLHTNDAVGAISRMKDLGAAPFLIASSLLGVMAQRLLRKICTHCATEATLSADELAALRCPLPLLPDGVKLQRGAGCVRCRNTGYYGRTAVFEILHIGTEVRELIAGGKGQSELYDAARRAGMKTLREAAVKKLAQGVTSFEEVIRMTASDL